MVADDYEVYYTYYEKPTTKMTIYRKLVFEIEDQCVITIFIDYGTEIS